MVLIPSSPLNRYLQPSGLAEQRAASVLNAALSYYDNVLQTIFVV